MSSSNLAVSIINIGVHLSAETQAYLQLTAGMMEVYVLGGRRLFINNPLSLYCVIWYIWLLGWIDIFDLFWTKTSIVCTIITYHNNEYMWQLMRQYTMIFTSVWLQYLFIILYKLEMQALTPCHTRLQSEVKCYYYEHLFDAFYGRNNDWHEQTKNGIDKTCSLNLHASHFIIRNSQRPKSFVNRQTDQ